MALFVHTRYDKNVPKDLKSSSVAITSSKHDFSQKMIQNAKNAVFTFHIWNMESIGFTCKKISRCRTFYTEKNDRAKKKFRLSRGVAGIAVGFWTKFEAQLAQPC
jgi:hypothetical protein